MFDSSWTALSGNTSDIANELLYTGRRRDPETGLQLNRNRFYAAHLGRWVNRDPIGYRAGDANLYGYVLGRPTYYVDSYGLEVQDSGYSWPGWSDYCDYVNPFNDSNAELDDDIEFGVGIGMGMAGAGIGGAAGIAAGGIAGATAVGYGASSATGAAVGGGVGAAVGGGVGSAIGGSGGSNVGAAIGGAGGGLIGGAGGALIGGSGDGFELNPDDFPSGGGGGGGGGGGNTLPPGPGGQNVPLEQPAIAA